MSRRNIWCGSRADSTNAASRCSTTACRSTAASCARPKVGWQNADQLRFILKEGRKRQIRRMCELVGLKVVGLKRVRIGRVRLGDLPPGQWRYLRPDERF